MPFTHFSVVSAQGGQQGSFSFGAQCSPNQPFSKLQGGIGGGAQSLLDALAEHTSYALAYTPVSAQAPGDSHVCHFQMRSFRC